MPIVSAFNEFQLSRTKNDLNVYECEKRNSVANTERNKNVIEQIDENLYMT
jgi:hypothetical protein